MKYRKKPVVIEATQWLKNGDHPLDHESIGIKTPNTMDRTKYSEYLETEGRVVRYFRHPEVSSESACKHCGKIMHDHGWIDTLEGGHIVCPRDWIITGIEGEHYPCKPHIFEQTYESAAAQQSIPEVAKLVEALERLVFAAKCRDNSTSSQIRRIETREELKAATENAEGALASYRQQGGDL